MMLYTTHQCYFFLAERLKQQQTETRTIVNGRQDFQAIPELKLNYNRRLIGDSAATNRDPLGSILATQNKNGSNKTSSNSQAKSNQTSNRNQ